MTDVILCGCNGRMGNKIAELANSSDKVRIVAGVDVNANGVNYSSKDSFPVYTRLADCSQKADVIIDFSHHTALEGILEYAVSNGMGVVVCTTGHTDDERELMKKSSEKIGVFYSRNMSLGINLLMNLVKQTAHTLGIDFDIEIVEEHHNKKLDAPSGTALMLADAAASGRDTDSKYVYERQSVRKEREKSEIGIHSVRGGTIVGVHSVIFGGEDEVIRLSHSATSRAVFAKGALKAAEFLKDKDKGFYDMSDVIDG